MDNNIADSVLHNFLNSLINSKNNQTKEDILLGKIKFPTYKNIYENETFKTKENKILQYNLLRRYKINLYAEERRKLERNVSNYEIQIQNLRQLNKDINIKLNNIEQNRLKSAYATIPNNNQIQIEKVKNINQRASSNYKKINYENRYQYIKKRNQSNSPIKSNNSIEKENKNSNNNIIKKNIMINNKIPENVFIKPLVSSIKKDILRIKNEEKNAYLNNNAKAFIKRLNGSNNKITSRVLKINREKNNDYIKKIEEDMKMYLEKKEKEKEENKIMKINENKKNKIGYFEGKQIINKKYHYYSPRNNQENYSNNILNNQIKNNEDNIKNNLSNENIIINKNKFLNIENYSNKNDEIIKENNIIDDNMVQINNFQRINYDFDYESPSILNQSERKSPYFFNEPKYNLSIEKRLEEFREKDKLKRKTYRSRFEDNNKSNNLSISNINQNNDLSNLNDNTELNDGNFNLNDNTELNEGNNFSLDNKNENQNNNIENGSENNIENEAHNMNENENNISNNKHNLNVNSD